MNQQIDPAEALAKKVWELADGESTTADLDVDDRVIARVTDGIYRQPSSALRELVSNAYDADASLVIIQTDAPRFDRIVLRDDGNGMTPDTLAYLISHIGGSSKRTNKGKRLGTVSQEDVVKSPHGRKLIGKIGIGLFAISQLTQHFQIITKREGDNFKTSAVVSLKTHTEERLADDEDMKFDAGTVTITKEKTTDLRAHGTEIILMNLRKATKDGLRSAERWDELDAILDSDEAHEGDLDVERPVYHIGRIRPGSDDLYLEKPNLPWSEDETPIEKFSALFAAVATAKKKSVGNPALSFALDNYLKMVWDLSVAAPVGYINSHPLETTRDNHLGLYRISNEKKGQAVELVLGPNETVSQAMGLRSCERDPVGGFRVILDGVELRHPIALEEEIRASRDGVERKVYEGERPLLFVGKCDSPLSKVAATRGGGALEFEGYFYWNPVIAPKENNGVLLRINGASGTLFDDGFLEYRVSELTRLRQLMAEVYVTKGLDPALNIDRESFNTSHPHYLFIKDWVHRAIRQVTNKLKGINKARLDAAKAGKSSGEADRILSLAWEVWAARQGEDTPIPDIFVADSQQTDSELDQQRLLGKIALNPKKISRGARKISASKQKDDSRAIALVAILSAYGLTENLTFERLESLVRDVRSIFEEE